MPVKTTMTCLHSLKAAIKEIKEDKHTLHPIPYTLYPVRGAELLIFSPAETPLRKVIIWVGKTVIAPHSPIYSRYFLSTSFLCARWDPRTSKKPLVFLEYIYIYIE